MIVVADDELPDHSYTWMVLMRRIMNKNLIKLHYADLFDINEEEFDSLVKDLRFTHTGSTGIPDEPLRHTVENAFQEYPDHLVLKRIWKHIDEKLCPDLELEVVKSFVNLYSHGDSSCKRT